MAKADTENVPEEYAVSLHLTTYEASVLYYVCRRIAGSFTGPRGAIGPTEQSIIRQLEASGIRIIKDDCVEGKDDTLYLVDEFECFEKLNKV